MVSLEQTRQDLFDILLAKNFKVSIRNSMGKEIQDASEADLFSFEYNSNDNHYGTVVITIDKDNDAIEVFYSDTLGKGMEAEDKNIWYDFLYQIRQFARRHILNFTLKNINKLKYAMQSMSTVQESKYYGYKKTSYTNQPQKTKLKIVHTKPVEEGQQRFRNVKALYVENSAGERFKLPFIKIFAGKAMARHVSEGGNPYDAVGQYICELVDDIQTLSKFTRYAKGQEWQEVQSEGLSERGIRHLGDVKRKVRRMIGRRGYKEEVEAFEKQDTQLQKETVNRIKELFTEKLLDSRIEEALPILAKLEVRDMDEVEAFNAWTNETDVTDVSEPEEVYVPTVGDSIKTIEGDTAGTIEEIKLFDNAVIFRSKDGKLHKTDMDNVEPNTMGEGAEPAEIDPVGDLTTITKAEWKKTHKDFKGIIDGKPYMLYLDPDTQGTISVPVKLVDESKMKSLSEELDRGTLTEKGRIEDIYEGKITNFINGLVAAGVITAGIASSTTIDDAINNRVPVVKVMKADLNQANQSGDDELAGQIKDELDNVILRLNTGKDINYVTKMQDKYL
jgi:hypothetical protein